MAQKEQRRESETVKRRPANAYIKFIQHFIANNSANYEHVRSTVTAGLCLPVPHRPVPVSNFIHQRVIEREREKTNKPKTIYNKHQNTIDVQDYQAYVAYKINGK